MENINKYESAVKELNISELSKGWLEVLKEYNRLNLDEETMLNDIQNGYLTINKGRNKKNYIWYNDGTIEFCYDIESGIELTEEEIEEQFC